MWTAFGFGRCLWWVDAFVQVKWNRVPTAHPHILLSIHQNRPYFTESTRFGRIEICLCFRLRINSANRSTNIWIIHSIRTWTQWIVSIIDCWLTYEIYSILGIKILVSVFSHIQFGLMPVRPDGVGQLCRFTKPHHWKPNSRKARLLFNYSIDPEFSYSVLAVRTATVADNNNNSFNRIELMNQKLTKNHRGAIPKGKSARPDSLPFPKGAKCFKLNYAEHWRRDKNHEYLLFDFCDVIECEKWRQRVVSCTSCRWFSHSMEAINVPFIISS